MSQETSTPPSLSERVRFAPYLNGFYDVARQWPDHILRRIDAADRATDPPARQSPGSPASQPDTSPLPGQTSSP